MKTKEDNILKGKETANLSKMKNKRMMITLLGFHEFQKVAKSNKTMARKSNCQSFC